MTLRVDVWSDIACPWCYIGKRRLEAALAEFPNRDQVEVNWRAFELDPAAPAVVDASLTHTQRLSKKLGMSAAKIEEMTARMVGVAASDGLDFRFDKIRSGNTFDAHRLLHLAHERGVQDAVKERFLRGQMTEGAAMGDKETLERLAVEAGLNRDEVRAVLTSDRYASEVRADEREARTIGVQGVPFFVIGGRYAVSGAQPAELLLRALGQAWNERPAAEPSFEEGAACGPDGCG